MFTDMVGYSALSQRTEPRFQAMMQKSRSAERGSEALNARS